MYVIYIGILRVPGQLKFQEAPTRNEFYSHFEGVSQIKANQNSWCMEHIVCVAAPFKMEQCYHHILVQTNHHFRK